MKPRLAIVASHVIQYQDPFFRLLAAAPEFDLEVLFLSTDGAVTYLDREMSTTLQWDIELLGGYSHRFLRNRGRGLGFLRHINPSLVGALARGRYDAVLFMLGWGSFSAILGIATCIALRIPFFLYGDSSFPPVAGSLRARLRAALLRRLFARATALMVSGTLNADYYVHYGADPKRFFLLPWAVDNDRFIEASRFGDGERDALRAEHGIAPGQVAFVYSAKLLPRKDPMTLLRAYAAMQQRDRAVLVYLGDGELRPELERYAKEHELRNVRFLGFINQRELPRRYAMCDVFVLPSLVEPRGSVINEAMACGLGVVVTDRIGAIGDIVIDGDNAFVFPAGDAAALARTLDLLVTDTALRERMGRRSREIIGGWSYARGAEGVKEAMRALPRKRASS